MLIPLGFLAGSGGGIDTDYELIETQILGSAQSSVTFTGLGTYSSTFRHLQIRAVTRVATGNDNTLLRINGDTGSNYNWHELYTYAPATSVGSASGTSQTSIKAIYGDSGTSNAYGAGVIDILDAYSTTKTKTVKIFTGATDDIFVALRSGFWNSTASITSLTLLGASGLNMAANSRFSLYGIRGQ